MNPEYAKFCCFVGDYLKKHPERTIAVDQWRGQGKTWQQFRPVQKEKRVYEFDGKEWQVIYSSQCTNAKGNSEDKETDG